MATPRRLLEAKCIIEAEYLLEEGEAKCFVVIRSHAELAQLREAKVQALKAQMRTLCQSLKECNRF